MAQDVTAVKESQGISAAQQAAGVKPWSHWLAVQRADTRLPGPLTYSHEETYRGITNISKLFISWRNVYWKMSQYSNKLKRLDTSSYVRYPAPVITNFTQHIKYMFSSWCYRSSFKSSTAKLNCSRIHWDASVDQFLVYSCKIDWRMREFNFHEVITWSALMVQDETAD